MRGLSVLMIIVGLTMIYKGVKAKELRMRIQRLKDGVLWIAAANDEEVDKIIISAGTWKAVFDRRKTAEEYTEMVLEKYLNMVMENQEKLLKTKRADAPYHPFADDVLRREV